MTSVTDISQDRTLLWLMAMACGLCAGSNYYCQPLIYSIQAYFQVSETQVAFTVTIAQVSYALGLLLIVPLGDLLNKQRFIPMLMYGAALGLLISASASNLYLLWFGTLLTGMFSVAAQVLIPFASMSVRPEHTGRVIGFLMSGLLVGILLSTSLAGLLSALFQWQMVYWISAFLMILLAYQLQQKLPYMLRQKMSYAAIFQSMQQLLRHESRLMPRSLIGACCFASMSILFSTIAVLLSTAPFHLTDVAIGLVSLIGIFGALSSSYWGRYADRGLTSRLTGFGLLLLAASWLFLYAGQFQLISYVLGYGMLNFGLAMVHSANQGILFRLRPDAKSRINAIYMTSYFMGGALGSALGIYAWHHGGWLYSCLLGIAFVVLGALLWAWDERVKPPTLALTE